MLKIEQRYSLLQTVHPIVHSRGVDLPLLASVGGGGCWRMLRCSILNGI